MYTFAIRIGATTEKEKDDTAQLEEKYGCRVAPFGQSQLPDEFRGYLHNHPKCLPIRWLPDLLVVRPDLQPARRVNLHADSAEGVKRAGERNYVNPSGLLTDIDEWMWLVDSKTGRQDTKNWDLEKAAHAAHRLQRDALGLPIVYIWPDGCSCSYIEDLPDEKLIDGPRGRSGSGTPYWLVPKKLTRSLDEVFGKAAS
jgi:hypothetical protein